MAEPKLSTAFWVRFDLINIADGSTYIYRVGDFAHIAGELYTSQAEIYPGLLDINGCTLEVGESLPVRNGGTVTIDCTRGVLGRDKRPSDLLRDYFWINSTVYVVSWRGYPDSITSTSGDVRTEFNGIVKDVDYNPQTNQMKVAIEPIPITTKFEQTAVSTAVYPSADTNFGKYLPICFGNPTVPGYIIYSDSYSGGYGYASYPTGYSNANAVTVYTPNFRNQYVPITDDNLINPTFGNTSGTSTGRTLRAPFNNGASPPPSRSFRQRFTATKNYLAQRISVDLKNVTGASVTYNMIFTARLYKKIRTIEDDVEFQQLATGSTEILAATVLNNGSLNVVVYFDVPVPIEIGVRYFLEFAIVGNENQVADYSIDLIHLTQSGSNVYRRLGTAADFDRIAQNLAFNWTITGFLIDDVNVNNTSNIVISSNTYPAGTEDASWDNLQIIVQAGGLKDDGSGTITGTANSPINDPYEITRFLLRDQLSYLDTSTYNAATIVRSTYPRTVSGYTKGRQSNEEILKDILTEAACKLVPRNDGLTTKLWALYPYGYQSSTVKYLSEQDCRLIGFKQFGRDSVVNAIDIAYGESALPGQIADIQAGQPQQFTKFKSYYYGSAANINVWTAESYARFGTRPLNNSWTELNWVTDDTTANFYAQYILQTYARPRIMVEIELPFFEGDNRNIQCMDIIELSHPDLPATFGTTPDSLTPLPVYNGVTVETANYGLPFRQAQSYKLQVNARQVIFNIKGRNPAALRLECRVLWNPYEIY